MRFSITLTALGALLLPIASAAVAKTPREQFCSFIRQTEDGKFTYDMQAGWSLYYAELEEGEIVLESDVVGVACLRDPVALVAEDAEALRQGIALYLADPVSQVRVSYELVDGVIQHEVSNGTLSRSDQRAVERGIAEATAAL